MDADDADHSADHSADDRDDLATWVLPVLLRLGRRVYSRATRAALAAVDCEDLPRNGPFVLGAISRNGSPLSELIDLLGISKQAAGQLVDTLVLRGYLDRAPDPSDRRRLTVTLTERGRAAAEAIGGSVDDVDAALLAAVGDEAVATMRATLAALIGLPEPDAER